MAARFGYTPVVPPFAGAGQDEGVVAAYAAALEALGGERWSIERYGERAPLCFLIATGGTEEVVLRRHALRQESAPGEPVLLIAHPGNNSLPASLEVLARIHQDGARGRIVYLPSPDDPAGLAELEAAVHDLRVRLALRSARIGMIGDPSDWLVASSPAASVVSDAWGPEVVPVPLDELRAAAREADEAEVHSAATSLSSGAAGVTEPTADDVTAAARIFAAADALAGEKVLDALTVRCFDLVLEDGTTGCYALSALTDNGVIAGCEGDIVSTVGMLWAHQLLGQVPWMANPAQVDRAENAVLLAHCTVPRDLVESYHLRSHFESGIGVGLAGQMALGPVTLLRIGGVAMDRLWVAEGDIVRVGRAENLCRTQVEIVLSEGSVDDLLEAPLGNHVVLVKGHHLTRLSRWWSSVR